MTPAPGSPGSKPPHRNKERDPIEAGVRVIIKRSMLSVGMTTQMFHKWTHDQMVQWAANHPKAIAQRVRQWYIDAVAERDPTSDESAIHTYERRIKQADTLLKALGIQTSYAGLYPTFVLPGQVFYTFDELYNALRMACATHVVKHDGVERFRSTDAECFAWLLNHQPCSVHHATTHEGWSIEPLCQDPPKT